MTGAGNNGPMNSGCSSSDSMSLNGWSEKGREGQEESYVTKGGEWTGGEVVVSK